MEAGNDEPRVRPIPIEDDPPSGFESAAHDELRQDAGPKHPWLPLTLAATAVIAVVGSVTMFGALQEADPPPPDAAFVDNADSEEPDEFSPPTTVAVALQEAIPGVTGRLTLIANGPSGPSALLWDPSFIQPKPFPIAFDLAAAPETTLSLRSATFDAGGDFVAVTGIPQGSEEPILRVGTPTDISAVTLDAATSFTWHATDVAHLAWIEAGSDGGAVLHTARVNPLSKLLMDEKQIASVAASTELVRWDGTGFILNTRAGEIVAVTNSGDEHWRSPGHALRASASTILVTSADDDPRRLSGVTAIDRAGADLGELFDVPVDDALVSRTVEMSRNTDLVARIDIRQNRTRIEMNGPEFVAVKILQYNDDVEPIGFTSNDKYLVFEADGSNDLVFFNWSLGSIHILSVPDQFGVVGLDLG